MAIRRNVKEIMEDILLQNSSGNAQADAVMREVIRVYEDAYPQHIAGYYVEGSYADRTHLATSDLDLVMIFRQPFADDEARKAAEQAWNVSNKASTLEVDITLVNEQELQAGVDPNLKLGSRFIYKDYLLGQLQSTQQEQLNRALWVQEHSPLADTEVTMALQTIRQ